MCSKSVEMRRVFTLLMLLLPSLYTSVEVNIWAYGQLEWLLWVKSTSQTNPYLAFLCQMYPVVSSHDIKLRNLALTVRYILFVWYVGETAASKYPGMYELWSQTVRAHCPYSLLWNLTGMFVLVEVMPWLVVLHLELVYIKGTRLNARD